MDRPKMPVTGANERIATFINGVTQELAQFPLPDQIGILGEIRNNLLSQYREEQDKAEEAYNRAAEQYREFSELSPQPVTNIPTPSQLNATGPGR